METTVVYGVLGVAAILVLCIWRILNWLWFKPKKIERFLRDQGLKGSPYKFMFGDLKELVQMMTEAKSKPMSLTHDIASRVSPFYHKSLNTYGGGGESSEMRWRTTGKSGPAAVIPVMGYRSIKYFGNGFAGNKKKDARDGCFSSPAAVTPMMGYRSITAAIVSVSYMCRGR